MRKTILFILWLLVPALLLAFHYGPGQAALARDHAADKIRHAQSLEQKQEWRAAMEAYGAALALLPADALSARFKLRLAQARTRMYTGELPEAIEDMEVLLSDVQKSGADLQALREVRGTLAAAEYYAGWLMRLEGAATDEWLIPVENSRQHFRLLSEESPKSQSASDHQKNLEAVIRLARMDLSELQGLPLPKFCEGCKNVSQKCRSQRESKCKDGKGEQEKEKKDARGAGFNERPKGGS